MRERMRKWVHPRIRPHRCRVAPRRFTHQRWLSRRLRLLTQATWRGHEWGSFVHWFNTSEVCKCLKDINIFVIGDSMSRHLYGALHDVLRGAGHTGRLSAAPELLGKNAAVPLQFRGRCADNKRYEANNTKFCASRITTSALHCGGSVNIRLREAWLSGHVCQMQSYIDEAAAQHNPSIVLLGPGLHFLNPRPPPLPSLFAQLVRHARARNVLLVWHTMLPVHMHPGVPPWLVTTDVQRAENARLRQLVAQGNCAVLNLAREVKGVVMDSFALHHDNMVTADGVHYAADLQHLKVQILLNGLCGGCYDKSSRATLNASSSCAAAAEGAAAPLGSPQRTAADDFTKSYKPGAPITFKCGPSGKLARLQQVYQTDLDWMQHVKAHAAAGDDAATP